MLDLLEDIAERWSKLVQKCFVTQQAWVSVGLRYATACGEWLWGRVENSHESSSHVGHFPRWWRAGVATWEVLLLSLVGKGQRCFFF